MSLNLLPRGAGPLPGAILAAIAGGLGLITLPRQELPNSQQQEEELPELSASTVVQTGGQGVEDYIDIDLLPPFKSGGDRY